jgi:membrane associated rhomboid family serine protease
MMRSLRQTFEMQAGILVGFVVVIWLLELIDRLMFGGSLDCFGIRPRTLDGLWGILWAPLLHGGWAHLAANSVPFVVLGWLVLLRGLSAFTLVSLLAVVIGGLGVWLFGAAGTVHIGASGLIFGYIGYLLARGYFERSFSSLAIAIGVAVVYGSVLFGLLPGQPGTSWEGHLFGFIGGVGSGRLLSTRPGPLPSLRSARPGG